MSVTLQTTVYVEGKCERCKTETFFWTRIMELEMRKTLKCSHCQKGELQITKYDMVR